MNKYTTELTIKAYGGVSLIVTSLIASNGNIFLLLTNFLYKMCVCYISWLFDVSRV